MVLFPPTQIKRIAESVPKCIKAVLVTHLNEMVYVVFFPSVFPYIGWKPCRVNDKVIVFCCVTPE